LVVVVVAVLLDEAPRQAALPDLRLLGTVAALEEILVQQAVLDQAVVVVLQQCCRSTELPKL
jgi:hypothetical protein